ncbi:MAG: AGE family epimerase/isomerase [Spirochaetales bacterium]|nr:AGE family epimerase/isomerase [Spirochaetales bacterium]
MSLNERVNYVLKSNILDFWVSNSVDHENGGFFGGIDKLGNGLDIDKCLILNSRILWSFSKAYNYYKNNIYLDMADRAYNYLIDRFWDKKNGGFYWCVSNNGEVLDKSKEVYGQSFAIYGLCEYFIAKSLGEARDYALKTYSYLEEKALDKNNNGYFEIFNDNWEKDSKTRDSIIGLSYSKSNNTHLHLMESYTLLYSVCHEKKIENSLKNLVEIMTEKIMCENRLNFTLYLNEKWIPESSTISCGHEIEAAWLLRRALDTIGDNSYKEKFNSLIMKIIDNCYCSYLDGAVGERGMFNEIDNGIVDKSKLWWVQAEACVGFYLGYEITKDRKYLEVVENIWCYIEEFVVDFKNGEWFYFGKDSVGAKDDLKAKDWKSFYHNLRCCIELLERMT